MRLSERILAAKGPIYRDQLKRWAADAKVLEDIAEGRRFATTSVSTSEPHIVEEMRVIK